MRMKNSLVCSANRSSWRPMRATGWPNLNSAIARSSRPTPASPAKHCPPRLQHDCLARSPRGWFHIRRLHLNRPQLIELRQLLQEERILKDAVAQAQDAKAKLQQRILELEAEIVELRDRKSTRLNSSHGYISYAVFCLKKN